LKLDEDDPLVRDPKRFLPLESHRRALRLETLVVRGGRGAGKSALFHLLGSIQSDRDLAARVGGPSLADTTWHEGFGMSREHPSPGVVGAFANEASQPQLRLFWFGWLCARLSAVPGVTLPDGEFSKFVPAFSESWDLAELGRLAAAETGRLMSWLDALDRSRAGRPIVVTYDALDRVEAAAKARDGLTANLLGMWLSLADRYVNVRPKVFVREDLFQSSVAAFADASKLGARSVSLEWRVEDLYRVLIKHMANSSSDLREWIESSSRRVTLVQHGSLGWEPPSLPETGKESQKAFVDHLAGEQMGAGPKKGFTYRWIPNRLQDAHTRAVPRSILALTRHAAAGALSRGPRANNLRLLHPEELSDALEKTSKDRVNELREEFPVVQRLEHLRGKSVMLDRRETLKLLSRPSEVTDEYGNDGEAVLATLMDIGAAAARDDGRIDVPDIYRYGFGILRKGGVKRTR
jgi:hypothetical protein